MIEIACNFGVNIHINKCHAILLNVILLNVIRKKFEIFWGISLCVKLFCHISIVVTKGNFADHHILHYIYFNKD